MANARRTHFGPRDSISFAPRDQPSRCNGNGLPADGEARVVTAVLSLPPIGGGVAARSTRGPQRKRPLSVRRRYRLPPAPGRCRSSQARCRERASNLGGSTMQQRPSSRPRRLRAISTSCHLPIIVKLQLTRGISVLDRRGFSCGPGPNRARFARTKLMELFRSMKLSQIRGLTPGLVYQGVRRGKEHRFGPGTLHRSSMEDCG